MVRRCCDLGLMRVVGTKLVFSFSSPDSPRFQNSQDPTAPSAFGAGFDSQDVAIIAAATSDEWMGDTLAVAVSPSVVVLGDSRELFHSDGG